MTTIRLNALTDQEFEDLLGRMKVEGDLLVDPVTGLRRPIIRGGDGPLDDDGDDESVDDIDDDDGESEEDKAAARREAKLRRSARKAARRELTRELGYGSVGALKDALAKLGVDDDESDEEGAGDSGNDADEKPAPKRREPVRSEVSVEAALADLRGTVAIELAAAGIKPEKVKRATKIVMDDLDVGDSPSEDEIADVIDELRTEEEGWFASSSNSDDQEAGARRGVPAPDRRGTRRKASEKARSAEIFEARKDRHKRFELPTS